jgi:hypothetical protein
MVVTVALLVLCGFGVAYTQSVWVGLLSLMAVAASHLAMWHRADLIPVSKERVLAEKKLGIVALVVFGILRIFN